MTQQRIIGPIEKKLSKALDKAVDAKIIDLNTFIVGKKDAEDLQKTAISDNDLASLHLAMPYMSTYRIKLPLWLN